MNKTFFFLCCLIVSQLTFAESLINKIDALPNDRTDILAIYKEDQLVYEEYRNGYKPNQKHKLWSMSKSMTSLLVARAVKEGRIDVNNSICEYVGTSEVSSLSQCEITVDRLLFWQSGMDWAENYIGFKGGQSSVLNGLYGSGINDFSKFYFNLPHIKDVKFNWNYSTGDSHILSYILRKVYSPMEYEKLPWTKLFDPLRIKQATFERDHQGTYLGGAYVFLSQQDLFQVAQFILNELKSPQYLTSNWLPYVLKAKPNAYLDQKMIDDATAPAIPGGHWWLNRPSNPDNQIVPWPEAPADTFAAFGVFGQMMFIIPSKNMVIIRLAQDIKGGFDKKNLLKVAFKYVEDLDP